MPRLFRLTSLQAVLIFLLLSIIPAESSPESRKSLVHIEITSIGQPGQKGKAVGAVENVSGTIAVAGSQDQPLLLQLAWRKIGEETWWISNQNILLAQPAKTKRWEFQAAELGSGFDARKDLEVLVCAIQPEKALPSGAMDYQSLRFATVGVSEKKQIKRKPSVPEQFFVTPRIRIARIDDQIFTPQATHEVGLKSIFSGEFRKPTNSVIRLVVSPVNSENYWVMEDEPLVRDGRWVAKGDFVSGVFEDETEFNVFAVIIREALPLGIPITLYRWSQYLETHISSASPVVKVTRIEAPPSKNQLALRFLSVDNVPVHPRKEWEVGARSGIRGKLTGRTLKADEAVWVLASDNYESSSWRAIGRATIASQRYWELSPQQLGNPGDYLKLIAIVAEEEVSALSNQQIEKSLAFSRQIALKLQEAPPMRVNIKTVDQKQVQQSEETEVEPVAGISGTISGRPLGKSDRVWILKMSRDDQRDWSLVGQAGLKGRHQWEMPPVAIGEEGQSFILMAVVSKSPVTKLTVNEQREVIAVSGRIHVRIVN